MRSHLSKTLVVAFAVLLGASAFAKAPSSRRTKELQEFKAVRYVPNESNDGDSFSVMLGDEEHRVRLYFVDCPETTDADLLRLRKQKRYFGLEEALWVIKVGLKAEKYVEGVLSLPFTVHTAFAHARGSSAGGRVYAFVTTSEGKDLARLLVAKGYARAYGMGRKTPQGDSRDDTKDRLGDLEVAAGMKKVGIWEKSDPDRIVKMREEQRVEDNELVILKKEVEEAVGEEKIDINTASKRKLQKVNGIGPVLAKKIIDGRQYKSVDELVKVKGIGEKTLEKMRGRFYVP